MKKFLTLATFALTFAGLASCSNNGSMNKKSNKKSENCDKCDKCANRKGNK